MSETAVVVPIPAAEHIVRPGPIPAHVTLLYPFADGAQLAAGLIDDVREQLGRFGAFDMALRRLDRFEGPPAVLYAAPEPAEPFLQMTGTLSQRFGFLPYEGVHDDLVPHLTIAIVDDPTALAEIEVGVTASLPISAVVDTVDVWEHHPAGWRLTHTIRLPS